MDFSQPLSFFFRLLLFRDDLDVYLFELRRRLYKKGTRVYIKRNVIFYYNKITSYPYKSRRPRIIDTSFTLSSLRTSRIPILLLEPYIRCL